MRTNRAIGEACLWECLSSSSLAEITGETERLVDGEVSLDGVHWGTWPLLLREDVSTLLVEGRVDTTESTIWADDLDEVYGLLECRLAHHRCSVDDTSACGDDLTTTTVNGIGMQGNIDHVVSCGTHVLLGADTLLGRPLESSNTGILDLVKVLDSLGSIDQQIWSVTVGTEAPNLPRLGNVPAILISHETGSELEVVSGSDLASLDSLGDLLVKGLTLEPDSVVLVLRLGQSGLILLASEGLSVSDDGYKRKRSACLLSVD